MPPRPRFTALILALAFFLLLAVVLWGPFEPAAQAQGEEDDRFVPSEELSADSAISFPVDI